ncbi:MAG: hypothetical protein V1667_00730 [bacterium]
MQRLSFERQNFDPAESEPPRQLPTDIKFLNKIMELKSKQSDIEEKIAGIEGGEREILKIELENIGNQISNYQKSLEGYNRIKKMNSAGRSVENNIGKNFLNSFEEFKKKKQSK